jgi:hypothetical protein
MNQFQPGEINSLESIPELLTSLQIRVQVLTKQFLIGEVNPQMGHHNLSNK